MSKIVVLVLVLVLHGQNCVLNENCLYKAILKSLPSLAICEKIIHTFWMVSPRQMVTRPIVRPRMLSVCDVTRVSPAPMRDNEPLMTISDQQHPILIHILITGHRPHVPRIPGDTGAQSVAIINKCQNTSQPPCRIRMSLSRIQLSPRQFDIAGTAMSLCHNAPANCHVHF